MAITLAELAVIFKGDDTRLSKDLDDAKKKTESASMSMAKAFGGALVGGATVAAGAIIGLGGKALNVATQIDKATDQIGASLGLSAEEAKKFGETIKQVYGNNWGDSIEDVGTAVENVAKQLRLTADDPALPKMTENAFRLRDVFGVEVTESVDAVRTLMENFGVTGEEAFDLIATGYQRGLDRSGDFLDTIGEYSVQFSNGGANASQFFKILEEGLQGGVLGTDKAADAFKEFGIRILDNSTLTKDSLSALGISYDDLSKSFADGSKTTIDVMEDVLYQIFEIEDPIKRATIGVGLFGTQWEDLGESSMRALSEIEEGFGAQEGTITRLDTKYSSLGAVWEGMWRKFEVGMAPAGEALLAFVNENLPAIEGVINTVTGGVSTFLGMIPIVMADVKQKWEADFGGMRTAAENFMTLDKDFETFWARVNHTFAEGGETNEASWASFLAGTVNIFTSWTRAVLDTAGIFFENWNRTQGAWQAATEGEWGRFWQLLGGNFEGAFNGYLNFIEFIFGPNFRNTLVGQLTEAWNDMIDLFDDIADWWRDAWGSLIGMSPGSAQSRTPPRNLGIVNPLNTHGVPGLGVVNPLNTIQQQVGDISMGYDNSRFQGVQFPQGQVTVNNITVNQGNGSYQQGFDTGEGVLDAMRFRGY